MPSGKGFKAIAAFKKKAGAWDAAVESVNIANAAIEYTSESIKANASLIESQGINGRATALPGDLGTHLVGGDITVEAQYQQGDLLLAAAMGAYQSVPTQEGVTTAWSSTLRLAEEVEGLNICFAYDKQAAIHEVDSAKVGGFSFSIAPGQLGQFSYPIVGRRLVSPATVNTTLAAATFDAVRELLLFQQMVVRIGAFDLGTDLTATENVYPNSVTLNVQRPFNQDVTTRAGIYIDEPVTDGYVTVGGSLSFPAYATDNDPLFAANLTKARRKMRITLTGGLAGTGFNYKMQFDLVDVQFSDASVPVGGPGKIGASFDFTAHRALTAPVGFTGQLDALWVKQTSKRAAPVI